jgi:hypothetical protein
MSGSRSRRFTRTTIAGVILVLAHTGLLADEEVEPSDDSKEVTEEIIEEIVVRASRPGGKIDVDARYEEIMRAGLTVEFERLQVLEQKYEWRLSEFDGKSSSRIKWGYDARDELRMRRDTKLTDLPIDDTKPATVFRFEF